MSDELLGKASRALREAGGFEEEEAALVRARILATTGERKRKRARKVIVLVPLAAVLVATTALATTDEGFSRAVRSLVALLGDTETAPAPMDDAEAAPKVARSRGAVVKEPEQLTEPPIDETDEGSDLVPEVAPAPAPAMVEERTTPSPRPAAANAKAEAAEPNPSPSAPEAVEAPPADLARFQRAYRLHFVDKDYEHALLAWEGYLRTSPGGQLAVEARYNRAMALVRLGRHREARIALEPFARGAFDGYRQSEARAILSALP